MDSNFENCLGKFSDSYEHGLEIFSEHMKGMKKANVI